MKNYRQICKEVAGEAYRLIDEALAFGASSVEFEMRFGSASVLVETGEKDRCGWLVPYQDVTVLHHDDQEHKSPLLAAAIERALPKWSDIEKVQHEQMQYSL